MEQNIMEHDVLNPAELLQKAGLVQGMTVADCGAGADAPFAMAAAKIVGSMATVYILDVVKNALEMAAAKAAREGAENVQTVWTDLEMYGAAKAVRNDSVDVAVLSNTLFQSQDHAGMFTEVARMLRPGGKLLVVDWNAQPTPLGPPVEQRVSSTQVKEFAQVAGLAPLAEFPAGEFHWAAIFQKGA